MVRSQDADHPFYIAGYMTGGGSCAEGHPTYSTGDPEFVNVIPPQQYLREYVFMTDPTMRNTNLVVVRTRASAGGGATRRRLGASSAADAAGWGRAPPDVWSGRQ